MSPRLPRKKSNKLFYLITDGTLNDANFARNSKHTLELIERAARTAISLIQIREKNLSARNIFRLARESARQIDSTQTKLLINERADIALAAGADGVHLTANSIPIVEIRRNFPPEFIIGVSCHSVEKCLEAKQSDADFAVLSPIFEVPQKGKPLGLEYLKNACCKLSDFPVLALGGINRTNFAPTLATAAGIAAIRFLNETDNWSSLNSD